MEFVPATRQCSGEWVPGKLPFIDENLKQSTATKISSTWTHVLSRMGGGTEQNSGAAMAGKANYFGDGRVLLTSARIKSAVRFDLMHAHRDFSLLKEQLNYLRYIFIFVFGDRPIQGRGGPGA